MCGMVADDQFREQRALQALESSRLEITNLTKASADLENRFSQYRVKSVSCTWCRCRADA